ncbi:MAG: phosphate acyltransferase PlsX [Pseudomonadota bacterium]
MDPASAISIDVMGADGGPGPLIAGLARLARKRPDLRFLLFGRADAVAPLLRRRGLTDKCDLRDCPDVVRMDDQPARTLRERRQSSMWCALEAVKSGEARVAVSAGNTGALLAMSVFQLRKAPGVARPAIAVHWPAERPEEYNTVLDMGADIRADALQLAQYALMGAEYARLSLGQETPRVALLNVGTEELKGPEILHEAAALIAAIASKDAARFSFIGFVEGTDLTGDRADVIVTDGFTGNVALKTAEGTASFLRTTLRDAFRHSWASRLAALLAFTSLRRLRKRIDPRRVNGGVFLGLGGAVVKSHGSADAIGFASAVELAARMAESDFTAEVASRVGKLDISHTVRSAGNDRGA